MTPEQIEIYNKAAELGTIPDEMNPLFLFSITHSHLLLRIVAGEFDPVALARQELENRGIEVPGIKVIPRTEDEQTTRTKDSKRKRGKKL